MPKGKGFGLIEIIVISTLVILVAASGAVVLQKNLTAGPTPIPRQVPTAQPTVILATQIPVYQSPTPVYQNSTPIPTSKEEYTFPTDYSCSINTDCVLKNRPYCCGEKLEYYQWCYPKNVEPEVISCAGVGSCPGLAGSAKSCVCQNEKCTAVF